MPRPRAACGTDAAYRRHLREGQPVDAACRQAHANTLRGGLGRPVTRMVPPPPTRLEVLRGEVSSVQSEILVRLGAMAAAVRDDDFYAAVDRQSEIDDLTERWANLGDEINYREGYAFLVDEPELRATLLAWGLEQYGEVAS